MQAPNPQLDQVFFALSDPTRRAIVDRLAAGPSTVGELAKPFAISAPAVTKHMKVLERSGLVSRRVDGRQHHCKLNPQVLGAAQDWLEFYREFWEKRLDKLEDLLTRSDDPAESDPSTTTDK
jgi:DNA-binding transcriptional ArsR family regulator